MGVDIVESLASKFTGLGNNAEDLVQPKALQAMKKQEKEKQDSQSVNENPASRYTSFGLSIKHVHRLPILCIQTNLC